jgi:hypothetical protein
MTDFMEIIFIQLTNKTRKVTVLEMLWKDMFRKFLVLFITQLAEDLIKANFSNDEGVEYSRIDQGIIVIGVTKRTRVPKKVTYLQDNEAITFIPPPHNALI